MTQCKKFTTIQGVVIIIVIWNGVLYYCLYGETNFSLFHGKQRKWVKWKVKKKGKKEVL